jgi:hypothetical protein
LPDEEVLAVSSPNILRLASHMLAAVFNSRSAFQDKPQGIGGRWIGEWISELSAHHGELRCVLEPASSNEYRAYFYARFSKLFSVGYVTSLKGEQTNGRTLLKAEEDLGPLAGGIYRCDGEATPAEFNCRYSCKYDQGVFRLKRLV